MQNIQNQLSQKTQIITDLESQILELKVIIYTVYLINMLIIIIIFLIIWIELDLKLAGLGGKYLELNRTFKRLDERSDLEILLIANGL